MPFQDHGDFPILFQKTLKAFDMQRYTAAHIRDSHFVQTGDLQRRCDVKCRIKMDNHSCEDTWRGFLTEKAVCLVTSLNGVFNVSSGRSRGARELRTGSSTSVERRRASSGCADYPSTLDLTSASLHPRSITRNVDLTFFWDNFLE